MHELAIADAVIATTLRHTDGRRVARVELKVGHLRQVVPSALKFSFELVAVGTPADGAELDIEEIPARVSCRDCAAQSLVADFPLACASCAGLHVDVIAGDELFVDALELEDEQVPLQELVKGR
jgi:hydrogenase nickel incorporation protein HypA/HybF